MVGGGSRTPTRSLGVLIGRMLSGPGDRVGTQVYGKEISLVILGQRGVRPGWEVRVVLVHRSVLSHRRTLGTLARPVTPGVPRASISATATRPSSTTTTTTTIVDPPPVPVPEPVTSPTSSGPRPASAVSSPTAGAPSRRPSLPRVGTSARGRRGGRQTSRASAGDRAGHPGP